MKNHSPQDGSDYDRLRELLVGAELRKISRLQEHFDVPEQLTTDVSAVLPQAIKQSLKNDHQMVESLAPAIGDIFEHLINRDINKFAKALFPVIGPAIRQSIAESFKQMIQTLNKTIEMAFTWQGLKWRFQSMRTGIPIAQIAMLQGLVYRVEQAFLIHRETGLLLHHVCQQDIEGDNADVVSSMLTAIGDFVGDSFNPTKNETLDRIEMGELSIWVERGPEALIAIAVRGEAPKQHRAKLSDNLEKIHLEFSQQLLKFNGDTDVFEPCHTYLQQCLGVQYQEEKKKPPSKVSWLILFLVVSMLVYWLVSSISQSISQSDYVALLEHEPGYIVTKTSSQDGQFVIHGLRDPLSSSFESIINQSKLEPDSVLHKFSPYQSLDSEFTLKRIIKTTSPPKNVTLSLNEGNLVVSGIASAQWIKDFNYRLAYFAGVENIDASKLSDTIDLSSLEAPETVKFKIDVNKGLVEANGSAFSEWLVNSKLQAESIEGLEHYDTSKLLVGFDTSQLNPPSTVTLEWHEGLLTIKGEANQEWIVSLDNVTGNYPGVTGVDREALINSTEVMLQTLVNSLQGIAILFKSSLTLDQNNLDQIDHSVLLIRDIEENAKRLSKTLKITIKGHSDSVGRFENNQLLSLNRAKLVTQKLYASGISPDIIFVKGLEKPVEKENNPAEQAYNRRVDFEVSFPD